jgi:nucleoside 2-deoxyribosyltransferase
MNENCPVCKRPGAETSGHDPTPGWRGSDDPLFYGPKPLLSIKCLACGDYKIDEELALKVKKSSNDEQRYILCALIREKSEAGIEVRITTDEELNELYRSEIPPEGPLDSIDRIIDFVHRKTRSADSGTSLHPDFDAPVAFAKSKSEFEYLLSKATELRYLESVGENIARHCTQYRLGLEGWQRLRELRRSQTISSQAFVAMWFDVSLEPVYRNGFEPALRQTGYTPIRVDLEEHNEKICDRVLSQIRRSGLLVADVTGQRASVLFEAGFALGLSIPVIWTCRSSDAHALPFDTRQYNHILWNDSEDLREKLALRIEATIPRKR